MTPAFTSYYPLAILLVFAAALAISLYLRSGRRWAGAPVARASSAVPAVHGDAVCQVRRLVAISGAAGLPVARMKSLARQPAPNRARAVERVVPIAARDSTVPVLHLVAKRPGLSKGSTRIERRLAVVR